MEQETITLEKGKEIVGIGKGPFTIDRVLKSSRINEECAIDNEEEDRISIIRIGRDICVLNLVEGQLQKRGRFEIKPPWKDACPKCKGSGQLFKLDKQAVTVGCHECQGSGKKKQKCPVCGGTTRFITEKPGLKINVRCKFCDDNGMSMGKCPDCRGTAKLKKLVNSGKVASSSICKVCDGSGIKPPEKEKPIFNDAMNRQLADVIGEAFELER